MQLIHYVLCYNIHVYVYNIIIMICFLASSIIKFDGLLLLCGQFQYLLVVTKIGLIVLYK